jgi:hypothetical protein
MGVCCVGICVLFKACVNQSVMIVIRWPLTTAKVSTTEQFTSLQS